MHGLVRHLRKIAKWWWALIAVAWSAFWVADNAIAKWGSFRVRAWWDAHTQHFPSNWETWLIGLLVIALALIIGGSYQHSRTTAKAAEAEVKIFKELAASLQEELRVERERSKPNFEIKWTPPVAGAGYELFRGRRQDFDTVYIQVNVLNRGAPSVIKNCAGFARLTDDTELEGIVYQAAQMRITVNGPRGQVDLPTNPRLLQTWSLTPIPTGGRGVGCIVFKFPAGTKKKVEGPKGAFILKIWDVAGKEYKVEILWEGGMPREVFSLPGMDPCR